MMYDPVLVLLAELAPVEARYLAATEAADRAWFAVPEAERSERRRDEVFADADAVEQVVMRLVDQLHEARATTVEGVLAQIRCLFLTTEDLAAFVDARLPAGGERQAA
jgi:hypothetical protein